MERLLIKTIAVILIVDGFIIPLKAQETSIPPIPVRKKVAPIPPNDNSNKIETPVKNAMNLKIGEETLLEVSAKNNCLNLWQKNIDSFARIQIPPGAYEISLRSKAFAGKENNGQGPNTTTPLKKAVLYIQNNQDTSQETWVVEENKTITINSFGEGIDANTLYAFFLDIITWDNSGEALLNIKKVK